MRRTGIVVVLAVMALAWPAIGWAAIGGSMPADTAASAASGHPEHPEHPSHPEHPNRPGGDGDDGTDESGSGLRLNDIQVRGTHNSTHRDPKGVVTDGEPFNWGYSHRNLTAQLEEQAVRQVEIDVHYNWAKDDFDVYHVYFGDDRVTCSTLSGCLGELREWSDDHPAAAPLMVLIEPKDGGAPESLASGSTDYNDHLPEDGDPFTRPFDEAVYKRLDEVLLASFDGPIGKRGHQRGRVVTPDDVTRRHTTLKDSILEAGWPLLDDVRGGILFVIDGPEHAEAYSDGFTSLAGRAMFVQAPEGADVAAFVERDGAREGGESKYGRMARLVGEGFMIRDLVSPSEFEDAIAAGAQFLSTDYPEMLTFGGKAGAPSHCNPVTIAASGRPCEDRDIERHSSHDYPVPPDPSDDYDQVVADRVDRLVLGSADSATALATAEPGSRSPIPIP